MKGKAGTPQRVAEDGDEDGEEPVCQTARPASPARATAVFHGLVDAAAHGSVVAVEGDGAAAVSGVGSKIMPSLTYLPFIMGRGARLQTMPIFLPIRSSGLNHLAMPDRMQRSRSPSNTVRVEQLRSPSGVLAGAHLGHAQLHLAEGVEVDLFLVGEVHGALLSGRGGSSGFGLGPVGSLGSGLRFSSSSFRWAISLATSMRGTGHRPCGRCRSPAHRRRSCSGRGRKRPDPADPSSWERWRAGSVQQDASHAQCLAQVVQHALQTGLGGLVLASAQVRSRRCTCWRAG